MIPLDNTILVVDVSERPSLCGPFTVAGYAGGGSPDGILYDYFPHWTCRLETLFLSIYPYAVLLLGVGYVTVIGRLHYANDVAR